MDGRRGRRRKTMRVWRQPVRVRWYIITLRRSVSLSLRSIYLFAAEYIPSSLLHVVVLLLFIFFAAPSYCIYTARVVFLLAAEYLNTFIFFSFSSPCHISNRFYSFHHTGVPLADCPCQYDDGAFAALYTPETKKNGTQLNPGYWLLDIGP